MGIRLYVGNLSKSTTQAELNALFAQAGAVVSAEVIKDLLEVKQFPYQTQKAGTMKTY